MNFEHILLDFAKWGDLIDLSGPGFERMALEASLQNPWFTPENTAMSVKAIKEVFLDKHNLAVWAGNYRVPVDQMKTVGLVLAGNIPAVGFHDILCVLAAGHRAQVKLSDKDPVILPYLFDLLFSINEEWKGRIDFVERLSDYDAVIATGSDNSARYFEYYFSAVPHIIRRNRTSVAVFHGTENDNDIRAFGKDVFDYFGLGCRNVTKMYLPRDYDVKNVLRVFEEFGYVVDHNKYKNNFDYNTALYLMNITPFLSNNYINFLEEETIFSRISSMHYEYYGSMGELATKLISLQDNIQCIASLKPIPGVSIPTVLPGGTQTPGLSDYADGVDTMLFLQNL